ncbi:uncharacterized protein N7483_002163 [Penicillium malachiteum]|uniref:uncharacterized protein n=1 Tax=Penicillium malachiteum TaxID=1324776 RepID=UPI0025480BB1|nr:uncharacterized protein N7483_002163 [Penicillium malachiteum]KAJ5737038.1 hypothetical protein N7483_002163 [Penicillium malachiteum]
MEVKSWYPCDFQQALRNSIDEADVDWFLNRPGRAPCFLYGASMLPTVLKHHIGLGQSHNIHSTMTQATLFGYRLYKFAESNIPAIIKSSNPTSTVEGLLVFNLDQTQRRDLYEFESGLMNLTAVQVQILQKTPSNTHNFRMVDAGTVTWTSRDNQGLSPLNASVWAVDGFLQSQLYQHISNSQYRCDLAEPELAAKDFSYYPGDTKQQGDLDLMVRQYGSVHSIEADEPEWF